MENMPGLQHPVDGKGDTCGRRAEDRPIDCRDSREQNRDNIAAPDAAGAQESSGLVDISAQLGE
jgi:hypothetical protein